jgi:hypothetical protein
VQGGVYASNGQKVADLRSIHLGMGTFDLDPQPNTTYIVKTDFKGKELNIPLPASKSSGVVMRVDNITNKDTIVVTIIPSNDIKQTGQVYYLIGQTAHVVCYGATVNTSKGYRRFSIHRSAFPTGVTRFTLLSQAQAPIAERIIFVDHHDEIRLNIVTSKATYANRDSVSLDLIATDIDGAPVPGSFSLAVTDDAQVKPDSTMANLPAKVLLADELKGNIENADWYFSKGDSIHKAASLDALLLTQGWVNYNWKEAFAPVKKADAYKAEPYFAVKGRVLNAFNKPVAKSNIVLLSMKPAFVADTITNEKGEFQFTGLYPFDTVAYNLQAKNKRGKMFNVGIEVNEFVPPAFTSAQQRLIPPYVNIDTARLNAIRTKALYNQEDAKITGRQLQEVKIKATKAIKGSKSLIDPGEADLTLDEEDMHAAGKATLLDVINKNIKGFSNMGRKGAIYYNIYMLPTIFIIDGMPTQFFVPQGTSYYLYMKSILEYIVAEDVKGVELMTSSKNQMAYTSEYILPRNPMARFYDFTFLEITTYSGNGLFMKKTPGNYLYRPPVFASTKEFYSPKYTVKKPVIIPDTRPTIFWAPNLITGNDGKASVSFYTADKTATYAVKVQGADMAGRVGTVQSKIKVIRKSD